MGNKVGDKVGNKSLNASQGKVLEEIRNNVELPEYNQETVKAMAEAMSIANDPSVKCYNNMEDLKKDLMDE